ncbi:MAG: hypothetical protein HXX13_03215 [Bacteroidetes bacterium]|nr:hypothetical protein [Bacteroidota bacterium]
MHEGAIITYYRAHDHPFLWIHEMHIKQDHARLARNQVSAGRWGDDVGGVGFLAANEEQKEEGDEEEVGFHGGSVRISLKLFGLKRVLYNIDYKCIYIVCIRFDLLSI